MNWLIENLPTIVVALIVFGAVALIVRKMIKDKRAGKTSCGCSCESCGLNGTCHSGK